MLAPSSTAQRCVVRSCIPWDAAMLNASSQRGGPWSPKSAWQSWGAPPGLGFPPPGTVPLPACPRSPLSPQDRLPFALNFHRVRERGKGGGDLAAAGGVLRLGGVLQVGSAVPFLAGGLLVGFPENPPASKILAGPELQYYIQRFEKSGFR